MRTRGIDCRGCVCTSLSVVHTRVKIFFFFFHIASLAIGKRKIHTRDNNRKFRCSCTWTFFTREHVVTFQLGHLVNKFSTSATWKEKDSRVDKRGKERKKISSAVFIYASIPMLSWLYWYVPQNDVMGIWHREEEKKKRVRERFHSYNIMKTLWKRLHRNLFYSDFYGV